MEAAPVPIVGAVVTQLRFDVASTLAFDAEFHLRVETAFQIASHEGPPMVLDPQTDLPDMGSLLTLHHLVVSAARTDDAGSIRIAFTDGRVLSCAPNPDFEAWTFTGPRGLLYVCLPGGGLAIWNATDGDGSSAQLRALGRDVRSTPGRPGAPSGAGPSPSRTPPSAP